MNLAIAVLLLVLTAWILSRRKKKAISVINEMAFNEYRELMTMHISYYQKLDDGNKLRFEKRVKEFLDYVWIEGVGTEINDLDKVFVAASAVIPVFGFPGWKYKNLSNVILYPDSFDNEFQFEGGSRNILGMVGSGYMNGQMLLSRTALQKGFSASSGKENTAIHEFVHLLDKSDGYTDGIPESLLAHGYTVPWLKMIHHEMHRIEAGQSDINPYALTSEAEFLAVASEYFFEKPEQLQEKHPQLYQQLSLIFGQDPALRK